MRAFDRNTADYAHFGPVEVARWEQFELGSALPFSAMWYSVEPGASSEPDCHPEPELSVVVAGTAWVEIAGEITEVRTGSSFLLDSHETHRVHNRSADQKLTIFSAYWMPPGMADAAEAIGQDAVVTAGV